MSCPARVLRGLPMAVLALNWGAALCQPAPPKFRLSGDVVPKHYAVVLRLAPPEETFHGSIEIEVDVRRPAAVIWLNATDLKIEKAVVQAGGTRTEAQAIPGGRNFVGISPGRSIGPGPATLSLTYNGTISRKSSDGLFLNREGSDWYIFSQFEPLSARRAFPCFDEPEFKVPWQLTLKVPQADHALSNTPILSEANGAGGMKVVRFAETKPLPSYLVALAVGPFAYVDAGKAGRNHVPVRIVTPRNRAAEAQYAARVTAELLTRLENYFGVPYPYEKLDNVALPLVFGFGAMENAGLITYAQDLILARPREESPEFRRSYALVAAHEMAHQWFGDLVTLAWWDDTWLNEAFATWMEQKIVGEWKPEWNIPVSAVFSSQGAMEADSLISARKIRQPIESESDIANVFDSITYEKGAAVIRMFETWVGPDKFQKGVNRYLNRHAYGNATAADFLQDVSAGAGRNMREAFSTFLDQAGVPLISISLECSRKRPQLTLSQRRYLPLGSQGSPQERWQIPVCVTHGSSGQTGRDCALLTGESQTVELSTDACPAWVQGNAGELGYYRVDYRGDLMNRLLRDGAPELDIAERVGALGNLRALVRGDELAADRALSLVSPFSRDPDRNVVTRSIDIVKGMGGELVPQGLRPTYERFIRDTYSTRARRLGWNPKPGEGDDVRLLRPVLLAFVARQGHDESLAREAGELARKWLTDRNAIAPGIVSAVLNTAAEYGDAALFDRFLAAAKQSKNFRERRRLFTALGSFRDPALIERALRLTLDPDLDARETIDILFASSQYPETEALPFEFVKQNFDRLMERLPRGIGADAGAILPRVAGGFCSMERYSEVERFFGGRIQQFTGGPRNLAQVLESIQICSAIRKAQQPSVGTFLIRYQRAAINPSHSAAPRSSTASTSLSSK